MNRGDYLVRFTSRQTLGVGGFAGDITMSQMVFRDVVPILHASGALEIEKSSGPTQPREMVVVYGPGFWQSIVPIPEQKDDTVHEDERTETGSREELRSGLDLRGPQDW